MNPSDRLALLQEFYREKAALFARHQAGAEAVSAYDANNAYQYVLAREDAHLDWLRRAIGEAGGAAGEVPAPAAAAEPALRLSLAMTPGRRPSSWRGGGRACGP